MYFLSLMIVKTFLTYYLKFTYYDSDFAYTSGKNKNKVAVKPILF